MDNLFTDFSKTANSNEDLTILYKKKVLLLGVGVVNAEEFNMRVLDLCDDFRGHSAKAVKSFNRGHHVHRHMLKWIIMKGVMAPIGQPLYRLVNKVFKGYLRELYGIFVLTAPFNPAIGAPCPPSRQKIPTWIVEACYQVPEEIFSKAWTECG